MKLFKYCEIKKIFDGFGVFTLQPIHDKDYVWYIIRSKSGFLQIPTWTKEHKSEIKGKSLLECQKLARDYDKSCDNSEWY